MPYATKDRESREGLDQAAKIKQIHEDTRLQLERRTMQYVRQANKGRKEVIFEPGDLVWVHLRKERFPMLRNSKLKPRGDGPFQVLERINDNA